MFQKIHSSRCSSLRLSRSFSDTELHDSSSQSSDNFQKFSFLVRRSDLSETYLSCIWSIENHILIVKWVPTEIPGQFQITNRVRYVCSDLHTPNFSVQLVELLRDVSIRAFVRLQFGHLQSQRDWFRHVGLGDHGQDPGILSVDNPF